MGARLLVFGANSGICHEVLKLYAREGASLYLVGRIPDKLAAVSDDLAARGGDIVGTAGYDFKNWQRHADTVAAARESLGGIDVAIIAHGTFPDQEETEHSPESVKACMDDNFTSVAVLAQSIAQVLSEQGRGTLAVVSSVAGDRGRKSNYTYGSAKAGIDAFMQGLRGRFSGSDIRIVNIKPGMTVSPMTAHMEHGLFWSTAEGIAPGIHKAITRGSPVHYAPGYWRLIMLVIRLLPNGVLARLPL